MNPYDYRNGGTIMNEDRIEIIVDQLKAIKDLWHILRASPLNQLDKESCEELLLDIYESKIHELSEIIKAICPIFSQIPTWILERIGLFLLNGSYCYTPFFYLRYTQCQSGVQVWH